MAMDPRMMQQMMQGMNENNESNDKSSDVYALADSASIDSMDDHLGDGGKDARGYFVHRSLDPRLASSRKFGFLWANKQIEKLIKDGDTKNPNFIQELRFYLMHNPARGPQYSYVHAILGSAPKHISPKTRAAAIRLLSEFDSIVDIRDLNNETPALKAVKLGDLASLTAIAQASNGKNVFDYSDSNNHNLLSIAAMQSPELIPFLLRSGVKSVSTNDGMHCVDIGLKSFLSTVAYNPKASFDKLYITLSALKRSGDTHTLKLLDSANTSNLFGMFTSLPKEYQNGLRDMFDAIEHIQPDPNILFKQKAPLFTNGVRKDKNGHDIAGHAVTYLEGVPVLGELNVNLGASLFQKASALNINVFDYAYTQLKNMPRYTDINFREFSTYTSPEQKKVLSSNISFLVNKLDTAMSKTGLLSRLAGTSISKEELLKYTPMLASLRQMEQTLKNSISDVDLFDLSKNIQKIKNDLNKDRMDLALASLIKQTTYEDVHTGKQISGSVNMAQCDLGLMMDNSNGDTLLTFACRNNHMATIDFCLSNDANLHCVDRFGNTPLHIAAEQGNFVLINKLIGQFNGTDYEGIHLAKSVANINVLNAEGKTFLDVLHESLPKEQFQKIYQALLEKHPTLKNMAIWNVPYWSLDLAEQRYLQNHSSDKEILQISNNPIFALEHADKFLDTDETKLERHRTNNQADDDIHYAKLKNDMMDILSLLQRSDLTADKRSALSNAFQLRVKHLSTYQQIGFMIEAGLSKDTNSDHVETANLKRETASRIARNILEEFKGANLQNLDSLTPKQREILDAFEKSKTPVPTIIAGLSILSMHDNTDRTLNTMGDYVDSMKKLETHLATALSTKYAPLPDEPTSINTKGPTKI